MDEKVYTPNVSTMLIGPILLHHTLDSLRKNRRDKISKTTKKKKEEIQSLSLEESQAKGLDESQLLDALIQITEELGK